MLHRSSDDQQSLLDENKSDSIDLLHTLISPPDTIIDCVCGCCVCCSPTVTQSFIEITAVISGLIDAVLYKVLGEGGSYFLLEQLLDNALWQVPEEGLVAAGEFAGYSAGITAFALKYQGVKGFLQQVCNHRKNRSTKQSKSLHAWIAFIALLGILSALGTSTTLFVDVFRDEQGNIDDSIVGLIIAAGIFKGIISLFNNFFYLDVVLRPLGEYFLTEYDAEQEEFNTLFTVVKQAICFNQDPQLDTLLESYGYLSAEQKIELKQLLSDVITNDTINFIVIPRQKSYATKAKELIAKHGLKIVAAALIIFPASRLNYAVGSQSASRFYSDGSVEDPGAFSRLTAGSHMIYFTMAAGGTLLKLKNRGGINEFVNYICCRKPNNTACCRNFSLYTVFCHIAIDLLPLCTASIMIDLLNRYMYGEADSGEDPAWLVTWMYAGTFLGAWLLNLNGMLELPTTWQRFKRGLYKLFPCGHTAKPAGKALFIENLAATQSHIATLPADQSRAYHTALLEILDPTTTEEPVYFSITHHDDGQYEIIEASEGYTWEQVVNNCLNSKDIDFSNISLDLAKWQYVLDCFKRTLPQSIENITILFNSNITSRLFYQLITHLIMSLPGLTTLIITSIADTDNIQHKLNLYLQNNPNIQQRLQNFTKQSSMREVNTAQQTDDLTITLSPIKSNGCIIL